MQVLQTIKIITMKITAFLLLLITVFTKADAQLYTTKNGFVGFYSKTPLEDIVAENNQVFAVMDVSKKSVAFSMLMKSFVFKKELMQEHFNENYVKSDKYPKATFTGSFKEDIDVKKDGTYTLQISGTLTMHGVSKPFTTAVTVQVKNNVINTSSTFTLLPQDFNIDIPSIVKEKIASEIRVEVKASLNP